MSDDPLRKVAAFVQSDLRRWVDARAAAKGYTEAFIECWPDPVEQFEISDKAVRDAEAWWFNISAEEAERYLQAREKVKEKERKPNG